VAQLANCVRDERSLTLLVQRRQRFADNNAITASDRWCVVTTSKIRRRRSNRTA